MSCAPLIGKHLQVQFPDRDSLFGTLNKVEYKKFVRKIVLKISTEIFLLSEKHIQS